MCYIHILVRERFQRFSEGDDDLSYEINHYIYIIVDCNVGRVLHFSPSSSPRSFKNVMILALATS